MTSTDQDNTAVNTAPSLRLVLEGGHARLGEVPAIDVARLIEGTIRAIARSAEVIAGREPGRVGRRGAPTENATRFVLTGVQSGSVAVLMRGPEQTSTGGVLGLELDDPRLTELALTNALDSLLGVEEDPYIARGLADLADELAIGTRYTRLRFEVQGGSAQTRSGVLNQATRARLHQVAERSTTTAPTAIAGTLVEADFERHTARIRTPSNRNVRVDFLDDHADEIQRALRQNAEFDGVVTFDPATNQAIAVEMRAIRRTHQLGLDLNDADYWDSVTIAEIADEQGVASVDLAAIRDAAATPDGLDRFFEALRL